MEYTRELLKDAACCVKCGSRPVAVHYDYDMWYVVCSNNQCKKHDKYTFLGCGKDIAVKSWNDSNRGIKKCFNRNVPKKRKKNETDSK